MSVLLHPYDYQTLDDLTYGFSTESGVEYVAYFLDMGAYSDHFENVYTFNFEATQCVDDAPQDPRISDTICVILGRILMQHRNAVIIVCDNLDHREQGRNRLFQSWFLRMENTEIIKIDRQYHSEEYDIFASLFIHTKNPDLELIVREFIQLTDNGFIPNE